MSMSPQPTGPAGRSSASQALEELVLCAADGDRRAQQCLLERYWVVIAAAVRGHKSRLGGRLAAREATADIQQSAALKVLLELSKHRWQGSSAFAAWVRRLAQVEVVDAFRHHRAQKRDIGAEVADAQDALAQLQLASPESRFEDNQRLRVLLEKISRLKPEYGAALLMHHCGFSHQEIGESLDCTPEAARKLVSRGRTRLLKLHTAADLQAGNT